MIRRWARRLFRLCLLVLLLASLWGAGLTWFVQTLPTPPDTRQIAHTDGMIVLTGGTGRLKIALDLLTERKADHLFITGVYRGVEVSELLRLSHQTPKEMACCITLDYEADDTIGNARQSAAWVRRTGMKSIRLVTSDYHIRRSLMEFRMAMPDITIIPHAVTPPHLNLLEWWQSEKLFGLMASEYSKFLFVSLRYGVYLVFHPILPHHRVQPPHDDHY